MRCRRKFRIPRERKERPSFGKNSNASVTVTAAESVLCIMGRIQCLCIKTISTEMRNIWISLGNTDSRCFIVCVWNLLENGYRDPRYGRKNAICGTGTEVPGMNDRYLFEGIGAYTGRW